ncbi:hypothetical protein HELRODRAFT_98272 [Helobdella robusta]|uniref:galactosylceramidase n=1 Tax=Helobdella robusta TaxID=6412 RepID=T1G9L6_HELRO|nr:hypothetical protein HELRODRAFT_98272 [Helobdella robusta]ESO08159.1 hypothetical protein HELRODRAFT_98272 [Helobdella robusta]
MGNLQKRAVRESNVITSTSIAVAVIFYLQRSILPWLLLITAMPRAASPQVAGSSDASTCNGTYYFDYSDGFGRTFDGVGAISGGGATSKLLSDYPEPYKSDILDFLFKPKFGAGFQIFKVEIGGDAQSSEGTESSHMHEEFDENYQRGYEWQLMVEAKKRNPKIRFCGLSWGYPGWLSGGQWTPYYDVTKTGMYLVKWVLGAKKYYDIDIYCLGIWNEKPYNKELIKTLRRLLDKHNMTSVKLVAGDQLPGGAWTIVDDVTKDPELFQAVDIIGTHYMGSQSTKQSLTLNKPLWSSEDWSSDHYQEGGGCMARLLNRNYLIGQYTSLIAWNMLCGFYPGMSYDGKGMMMANEPWSGHYEVGVPIWAMAHTTQFTEIGWRYLNVERGVGWLNFGGSYVTLVSPSLDEFTIVIETMDTSENKFCNRPPAFPMKVLQQTANLALKGDLARNRTYLHLWRSILTEDNNDSLLFNYLGKITVNEGRIDPLNLSVNSIYTLTTLSTGFKGKPRYVSPQSGKFPSVYKDDFESYREYQEAVAFSQQVGVFEIRSTNYRRHNKVMRQVILNAPVHWCPFVQTTPMGVIGDSDWTDTEVSVDVMFPFVNSSHGAYVAVRVDHGGCTTFLTTGVFFYLSIKEQRLNLYLDISRTLLVESISVKLEANQWYRATLIVQGKSYEAYIDGTLVMEGHFQKGDENIPTKGYVSIGTQNFGFTDFDNLSIFNF